MLEILSHQYLKKFVKTHNIDWDHIFSFGRIISKCIDTNSTYLINSEIFISKDWIFAILISLFLKEESSIFVLSNEQIEYLKNVQIKNLESLGFRFSLENNKLSLPNHYVDLVTLQNLLIHSKSLNIKNHRIVLSGIESIKKDLKNYFRISLSKKDWLQNSKKSESLNKDLMRTYNLLREKFFLRKVSGNSYLSLDENERNFLSDFFADNSSISNKFLKVSNALSQGLASLVKIDDTNFEWNLYLEPLDELSLIKKLLVNNKFVFFVSFEKDTFFQNYLKTHSLKIDLVMNFKSNFTEKLKLYV